VASHTSISNICEVKIFHTKPKIMKRFFLFISIILFAACGSNSDSSSNSVLSTGLSESKAKELFESEFIKRKVKNSSKYVNINLIQVNIGGIKEDTDLNIANVSIQYIYTKTYNGNVREYKKDKIFIYQKFNRHYHVFLQG